MDMLHAVMEEVNYNEHKKWSTYTKDEFLVIALLKRGIVGDEVVDYIGEIYDLASDLFKDFCELKTMGWENLLTLATHGHKAQDKYIAWYMGEDLHPNEKAKEKKIRATKSRHNLYFEENDINIVIS